MANWTQAPPEREGWYWIKWDDKPAVGFLILGGRCWDGLGYSMPDWYGPAIPSPDELEAMEEYIAAGDSALDDAHLDVGVAFNRFEATRSALKKIREGKP